MPRVLIKLPSISKSGSRSLEQVIAGRRTRRSYRNATLSQPNLSQLLWAGQGINYPRDALRTAPSAGALYPLELYCVIANVSNLETGIYKYRANGHKLQMIAAGDVRKELAQVALDQNWLKKANLIVLFSAVKSRTIQKYGSDSQRYIFIEIGHAAQNILLQAEALKLASAVVGAFYPDKMKRLLNMQRHETPLYLLSVGLK